MFKCIYLCVLLAMLPLAALGTKINKINMRAHHPLRMFTIQRRPNYDLFECVWRNDNRTNWSNKSYVYGAPYQELVPKPGHVAVYIREGDTPLSEIHPSLAEAFNEVFSEKQQIQDKTTDIKPEAEHETEQEEQLKEEIPVEEVTASDIAEFDEVKANDEESVSIVITGESTNQSKANPSD